MIEHREPLTDTHVPVDAQWRAARAVSASVSLAVVLFTTIVLARAVSGHLDRGLTALPVFGIYVAMTLIAGGTIWYRVRTAQRISSAATQRAPTELLAVAIVSPLLTAMVLGRDLSAGMLVLLWMSTALLSGISIWLLYYRTDAASPVGGQRVVEPVGRAIDATPAKPAPVSFVTPAVVSPTSAPTDVQTAPDEETFSQRWIRREGEMGDELEGTLKILFAPDQRTATADIPIVPAMAAIPDVDCEPLHPGDNDVQVLVRGTHTYGVRLELQRPAERSSAEEIELAVLIHAEREPES